MLEVWWTRRGPGRSRAEPVAHGRMRAVRRNRPGAASMSPATMLEDPRFAGWHRPDGWSIVSLGVCRGCRQTIAWARTPADRSAPLDRDGTNHFATCPEAERFRRRQAAHR
jgi:hypothetical protein